MSEQVLFPVTLVKMGSFYKRRLVDVDGNTLKDKQGQFISVWTSSMKEMLETKALRCIYKLKNENGYRYFVTSEAQKARFNHERDHGSPYPHTRYYIYEDDYFNHPPQRCHQEAPSL